MKKYFIHFTAIVTIVSMLFTTSCQRVENPSAIGVESEVTFSVSTPDIQTRAYSDGTTANKLTVAVYNGESLLFTEDAVMQGTHADVTLTLVNGMNYNIVFWAQAAGAPYTFSPTDRTMTVNYDGVHANDENLDAFWKKIEYKSEGAKTQKVELTRPFAQLNIAANDWDEALELSKVEVKQSKVKVEKVYSKMDMFTGAVAEESEVAVEFGMNTTPNSAGQELRGYTIADGYRWLAMNYLLVNEQELVVVTFNTDCPSYVSEKVYRDIPVKRNYRTNIYGKILTSDTEFDVETKPGFDDEDKDIYVYEDVTYVPVADADAANMAFAAGAKAVAINLIEVDEAEIILPSTTEDVYLLLPNTDKEVDIKYATSGEKPGRLYVTIPNGKVATLNIDTKESTVYINGDVTTLTAGTAPNTLYIVGGKVETLHVAAGNVVIENYAGVENIVQTADNNGTTKVIVAEGADMPNNINNDSNIIIDGDVVVVRGSKGYGSLDAALSDSENTSTTITLCKNLVLTSPLTIHNELTINLREYDLTYTSDVMGESMIDNKGKLTFEGNGRVIYTYTGANDSNYGKGNYLINNSSDLTINGGSFKFVIPGYQGKKFSHALYVVNTAGNFTMNGGELVNDYNNAVRFWATSLNDVKTLTVNNGYIKGLRAIWLQLPSNNASQAPKATININGGKLEGTAIDGTADSGNILAFYSYSYGQSFENVNINITGGEIVGDVALTGGNNKQIIEKLNISGGTFDGLYGDVYSYGDNKSAAKAITITGGKFSSIDPMKYMDVEGEIVTLAGNIEVSTDESDTYMLFDGVGTLDLNNKTIKHTSARTGKNQVMIDVRGKLTVKDGTITTQHIGDNMAWSNCTEIFYVGFNGTLNLIDATLENLGGSDMAYCVDLVNASEPDGITVNIENSVLKSTYIPFRVFNNGNGINKVTINNSTLEGTSRAVWIHIYTVEDNKGVVKDSTLELDIYDNGNTFIANDPNRIIEFGFTNPINFDAYGNPLIKNAAQLKWFADQVNVSKNSFAGKTVKLIANINLENKDWEPIGQTGKTTFLGVFDGQEHTISNLNIDSEAETGAYYSSGLFGWIESHTQGQGHIKNVKISNATVKGHHNCGALVGYITQETALVENCHVENATITCTRANDDADGDKAGAMIGNATVATPVKNCTVSKSTVSAGRDAGQVIGAGKEANVTGCSASEVTVTANGTGTGANVRNEVIGRLL